MRTFIRIMTVFLVFSISQAHAMRRLYGFRKKHNYEPIKLDVNPTVTFPGRKLDLIEVPCHCTPGYDRFTYIALPLKLPENSKRRADYLKDFTKIILHFCDTNKNKIADTSLRLIGAEQIAETIDSISSNDQTKILPEIVYNFFDAVEISLPYYKPNENLLKDPKKLPKTDSLFFFLTKTNLSQEYNKTKRQYKQLEISLARGLKKWIRDEQTKNKQT